MATINITSEQLDSNKLEAIKSFLKSLKLKFDIAGDSDIPQWQKDELDVRLKEHKSGKAEYVDWKSAKKSLRSKSGK